ncbi:ABC transporter ATP-binding protein [Rhizobium sp. IMFF44]|uniref:ABC transporter ATP-binding protein n=1 Tax=Rhizobium sp. IMFF44 TaxID=3342350 RepID=UPI0035BAEABA
MANVSIRELAIDFGSVSVLKSLNLEIQSGEFIVLLGPSGCGKSTLLNAIAGLTDITDGQIWIGDRNVTWEEPKDRGIGMVFQSYALYPTMTVEGNLSFGLRIAGMPKDEIAQRVDRAVQILQIDPLRKRRPGELSGGQRQRVAIGRALVRDVDVFLFDEPLSNLDAKLRTELRVELKRLHSGLGSTMIYVTHDQIEALTLADRIAVMSGGVIQQFATPKEIYRRPVNRFVAGFVGSPSMNFLSGQVTSNGGVPAFALPDGRKIDLNGYEFSGMPGEGRKATLGVRPEQMQFQPAGSRAASLPATFTIVEPMGSDNLIWGQVGSETLSVRIDADEDVALDTEQPVYFQPALASLFGEDGQRL